VLAGRAGSKKIGVPLLVAGVRQEGRGTGTISLKMETKTEAWILGRRVLCEDPL
jgi:hypothetical protein